MPDVFIGQPWNTDPGLPTKTEDWRKCPECGETVLMQITAYQDVEYWTCPRGACRAHTTHEPERGKFGRETHLTASQKPDRTRRVADFKRSVKRKYLTAKRRREMGLED